MRILLTFCLALPLTAGWNYSVLSGATESAFVSRLILFGGDVPQERNYVAYRDASGSLAVARFSIGFTAVTVWPGVSPSNTFVSLSPTGTLLVTFWNNNQYRYAMSSPNGTGNCGPSFEYRCGTVPLMPGFTTTAIERIVGEVDSDGTAHFVYAQRSPGSAGNRLVSATRSPAGVWTTVRMGEVPGDETISPANFSYGPTPQGAPADGWVTGTGSSAIHYVQVLPQAPYSIPAAWKTTFVNSERRPLSRAHCTNRSIPPAEPIGIRVQRRNAAGQLNDESMVVAGSLAFSTTNWCDISVNSGGTAAVVAFTTTAGVVTIARSPGRNPWSAYVWPLETVDATSTFSRPQVAYRLTGKLLVGYQGSSFFKLAVQQ